LEFIRKNWGPKNMHLSQKSQNNQKKKKIKKNEFFSLQN
jgi:hypothetical protein